MSAKEQGTKWKSGGDKVQNRKIGSDDSQMHQKKDGIFGFMADQIEIVGDIESPVPDWMHWEPAKNREK